MARTENPGKERIGGHAGSGIVSPVALLVISIMRQVGAWQWKCAATKCIVPGRVSTPEISCVHRSTGVPGAQPSSPHEAHSGCWGTSYSPVAPPMPQV